MRTFNQLLLLFFLLPNLLLADAGIYETYISFSIDNGGEQFYGTGGGNPSLSGSVLATNLDLNTSTFEIVTRGINTWQNNGTDVQSGRLNYRVYLEGTSAPAFTTVNLPYSGEAVDGGSLNKFWNTNSPRINVLEGLFAAGTYTLEVYWDASTNNTNCNNCDGNGILYESNGGANFFATFTVSIALPVELTDFTIDHTNKSNVIKWSTASEVNHHYFILHHSNDGQAFKELARIYGTNPTGDTYHYIHNDVTNGMHYYKLTQHDLDGKWSNKGIQYIQVENKNIRSLKIYPNPTSDYLRFEGASLGQAFRIYNDQGIEVLSGNIYQEMFSIQELMPGKYLFTTESQVYPFIKI